MDIFKDTASKLGYGVVESIEEGRFRWISPTLSASHRTYSSEDEAWQSCYEENKLAAPDYSLS
jgi:hypothetical protein